MRPSLDTTGVHIPWLTLISALVLLTVFNGAEVAFKLDALRQLHGPADTREYTYVGDDFPTELPLRVGRAAVHVEWLDDEVYGLTADGDWASNFPRSNGWVSLAPRAGAPRRKFALSMYHQLHCLDALRYGYVSARARALVFPGNGTGVDHHVNHCLSYLREMVLCAADVTLETSVPVRDPLGGLDNGASGMGITHKCRDWVQVREYLEQNYDDFEDGS